jgi:hypothetical protein
VDILRTPGRGAGGVCAIGFLVVYLLGMGRGSPPIASCILLCLHSSAGVRGACAIPSPTPWDLEQEGYVASNVSIPVDLGARGACWFTFPFFCQQLGGGNTRISSPLTHHSHTLLCLKPSTLALAPPAPCELPVLGYISLAPYAPIGWGLYCTVPATPAWQTWEHSNNAPRCATLPWRNALLQLTASSPMAPHLLGRAARSAQHPPNRCSQQRITCSQHAFNHSHFTRAVVSRNKTCQPPRQILPYHACSTRTSPPIAPPASIACPSSFLPCPSRPSR